MGRGRFGEGQHAGEKVSGGTAFGRDCQNNFDLLRFAAASLVLVSHSYPLLGRTDEPVKAFMGYVTGGMIAVASHEPFLAHARTLNLGYTP